MPEFDKRESVKVDDVEIMLGVLNRKLHEQLLETGLVTVAQWNSEIAPRLKAVADVLIGSRIHARSYRVHASSYPQAEHGAIAAKQAEIDRLMLEHCPGEMTPAQTAEWEKNQRPIVAPSAELDSVLVDLLRDNYNDALRRTDFDLADRIEKFLTGRAKERASASHASTSIPPAFHNMMRSLGENRCFGCGWPLGACRPFDCSMRYREQSEEHAGWLSRTQAMYEVTNWLREQQEPIAASAIRGRE